MQMKRSAEIGNLSLLVQAADIVRPESPVVSTSFLLPLDEFIVLTTDT